MSTAAQILANRANAQKSTGPATEEGKARSARNNFRHGLASGQLIVPGEDPAEFESLAEALFNEHQPATATEENFVLSMAQHFWLGQRAISLQSEAFAAGGSVSQLSLLLRYQTSNQRAYSRCLADLLKLRSERHKHDAAHLSEPKISTEGFERQKTSPAAPLAAAPLATDRPVVPPAEPIAPPPGALPPADPLQPAAEALQEELESHHLENRVRSELCLPPLPLSTQLSQRVNDFVSQNPAHSQALTQLREKAA